MIHIAFSTAVITGLVLFTVPLLQLALRVVLTASILLSEAARAMRHPPSTGGRMQQAPATIQVAFKDALNGSSPNELVSGLAG